MDQNTRNTLRNVVTQCRRLLEESVAQVLQGQFGIYATGKKDEVQIEPEARMSHLTDEDRAYRQDLLDHYEHIKALGYKPKDALAQLIREVAFTHLNRFCAYRMMESRRLIRESVSKGLKSQGFLFYLADHEEDERRFNTGQQDVAYRHFLNWLGGTLSEEIGVLFAPTDPANRLYPPQRVIDQVLGLLNDPELVGIWSEDEAIGWVYQYFTPKELRDQARKESQAPRNSYELAFRNQFFTPRYVVEFLTDNTLGRIWYEMRQGDTRLKDQCRYMVRRPTEVFLKDGEAEPKDTAKATDDSSQEELLKLPVYVPFRAKKHPRDLRILDPACGSGHFLLYCFDLLLTIYEEAYGDPDLGPALKKDYPSLNDLRRDVPRLILAHNLHGIDIDPRASQIAALALWLRCQRAYQEIDIKQDRPKITRSNIVCAEPMPGETSMLKEFVSQLEPKVLGQVVEVVFDKMKLAGEVGALLKIEAEIQDNVASAKEQYALETTHAVDRKGRSLLFSEAEMGRLLGAPRQASLFDVSDITDGDFFEQAEASVLEALRMYAQNAQADAQLQRRLFADDAVHGFAFVDICHKRFDVILMNPPFGEPIKNTLAYLGGHYPRTKHDLFAAFCDRAFELLTPEGLVGEISSRVGFFIRSFEQWRDHLLESCRLTLLADLGAHVLDSAAVEAACYVLGRSGTAFTPTNAFRLLAESDKATALLEACQSLDNLNCYALTPSQCNVLPLHPFIYWAKTSTLRQFIAHPTVEPTAGVVRQGLGTGDNFRFIRALWEVPVELIAGAGCATPDEVRQQLSSGKVWAVHVRSGASQPWYSPLTLVIDWASQGESLKSHWRSRGEAPSRYIPSEDLYFHPGISWTLRAFRLIPYVVPTGCIPSASRYMAFPVDHHRITLLGLSASAAATLGMRFYGESFERPKHLVDTFKRLPFAPLKERDQEAIGVFAQAEVLKRKSFYGNYEPYQDFVFPEAICPLSEAQDSEWDLRSLLDANSEKAISAAIGLTDLDMQGLMRDLDEAIQVRRAPSQTPQAEEEADEIGDTECDTTPRGHAADTLLYALGCSFGRWDVRMARDITLRPKAAELFHPMPVAPVGMLLGPDGMPAREGRIASRDWLRARQHAADIPTHSSLMSHVETNYPLKVQWDGIICDDAAHPCDANALVEQVLEAVWPDTHTQRTESILGLLGIKSLRDYFRKPGKAGAWQDHIARYSKSRRKAPIYWLLQSSKRNYAIWLYYHRLDKDILFKALVNYVEPKIRLEADRLESLRSQKASGGAGKGAKKLDKDIEKQEDFLSELRDFEEKLRRAAEVHLVPDLNDGVVLNIALLHELVPWKEAEKYWTELLEGQYEWSSIGKQLREKGLVK
jgi:hypothetical protein